MFIFGRDTIKIGDKNAMTDKLPASQESIYLKIEKYKFLRYEFSNSGTIVGQPKANQFFLMGKVTVIDSGTLLIPFS